jgi:hypothetical protein
MRGTVWVAGGCTSWYLDATGRNSTIWPSSTRAFRKRVAPFHARDYVSLGRAPRAAPIATLTEVRSS